MILDKNTIALIPARGGSKGLPGKNIIPLNGFPLIYYSIKSALDAGIDKSNIWVTTDCPEIAQQAECYQANVLRRPAELAADETSMMPVIKHAIDEISTIMTVESLILLQPTSPLRTGQDIAQAYEVYGAKSKTVISVYKSEQTPFKAFKVNENGELEGAFSKEAPFQRRQDFPATYYANGAIYIFKVSDFLKYDEIPTSEILSFEMPVERSVDVDTLEDLKKIEDLMKKEK